jgi:hypothetical protein
LFVGLKEGGEQEEVALSTAGKREAGNEYLE